MLETRPHPACGREPGIDLRRATEPVDETWLEEMRREGRVTAEEDRPPNRPLRRYGAKDVTSWRGYRG